SGFLAFAQRHAARVALGEEYRTRQAGQAGSLSHWRALTRAAHARGRLPPDAVGTRKRNASTGSAP
ncbi:hypothetical protein, partial [Ralstonia solanacearum]|uniref:hypothetical protein n=1 Tax=Ralstonia solanacearum TaxID=305 RepID=UPI0019D392AA